MHSDLAVKSQSTARNATRGQPPSFTLAHQSASCAVAETYSILTRMGEARESRLDHVFGAVADPTRRAILGRLGKSPARVTEIARDFPISLNSVSKHLQVLERAGLVRREIRGREHVCTLNAQPLREASRWMEEVRTFWEARLDALERHLTSGRKPR
jgi:DNA-binding transcriptional ArsR family regulator